MVELVDADQRVRSQPPAAGAEGTIEQWRFLPVDRAALLVFEATLPGSLRNPHEDEVLVILKG